MSLPTNVTPLLKQAQVIARQSLIDAGYRSEISPPSGEQAAIMALCLSLAEARLYSQMIEDELYEEVLDVFNEKATPPPWSDEGVE